MTPSIFLSSSTSMITAAETEAASISSSNSVGGNRKIRTKNNCMRKKVNTRSDCLVAILLLIALINTCSTSSSNNVGDGNSGVQLPVVNAFVPSCSNSFSARHPSQSHLRIIEQRQKSKTSSVSLEMVATKSGGKPILTVEQFQSEILLQTEESTSSAATAEPKPTLVLYSAPWCGPCRLTNPIIQQISKQYSDSINVFEICTDDLPSIAESAGVVSIPTIQLYYNGRCYDTIVGCVTKNVLGTAIDKVLDDLGLLVDEEEEEKDNEEGEEGDTKAKGKGDDTDDSDR
jgi:thioredoxin 1